MRAILVVAILWGCVGGAPPASSPHPSVSRSSFADRPDMVLVDFDNGTHALFNPRTCGLEMAWRGSLDARGKVHDFSQETSRAKVEGEAGEVLVDRVAPGVIADRVTLTSADPRFEANFSLAATADAWLWFEEVGRTPVHVDIADAVSGVSLGWFESACHVTSETDWQWNVKRLPRTTSEVRLALSCATLPKEVRGLRVLRELVAWTDAGGTPRRVRWRGYEYDTTGRTLVHFDLVEDDGSVAPVTCAFTATRNGFKMDYLKRVPEWARCYGEVPSDRFYEWEAP